MIENVLKGICHVDFAKGFDAKVITWLLLHLDPCEVIFN